MRLLHQRCQTPFRKSRKMSTLARVSTPAAAKGLITKEREVFHRAMLDRLLVFDPTSTPPLATNADKDNPASRLLAFSIATKLGATSGPRLSGQAAGTLFENITESFLTRTFQFLGGLRPGDWLIKVITGRQQKQLAL